MTERPSYGLALDEYSKSVPPGWMPGIHGYPLKLYVEKFDLWKRQTNVAEEEIGVTTVGRLKNKAYRVHVCVHKLILLAKRFSIQCNVILLLL